eukprot:772837-Alexandrium_andersonii.AAC.1
MPRGDSRRCAGGGPSPRAIWRCVKAPHAQGEIPGVVPEAGPAHGRIGVAPRRPMPRGETQ